MEIVIKKATIKSSIFLSYDYEIKDSTANNTSTTKSDAPIHDDLRNAFKALIPHFAFICEEITNENLIEDCIKTPEDYLTDRESSKHPELLNFYVHEFSLSGKGDGEKVRLTGSKQLKDFESISFSTPDILLESSKYPFIENLADTVDLLKREVMAYMEGKQAPKAQLEMFSEEEEQPEFSASIYFTNEEGEIVEKKLSNDVFKKPTKGKGKKIAEEEF